MTPLIQAPSVIPQLILSLCTVSIATCNKLFENMTPFNGNKVKPRISRCTGNKNFSWVLLDAESAVTCMNINSFEMAFGKILQTGDSYKINILIKGRKCTHTIIIMDKSSENILAVDFIQKHRLHYNHDTQQVSFLQTLSKAIFAMKNMMILPLSSTILQARSFEKISKNQNYLANICIPRTPLISGPSSLVTFNDNNHCSVWR